MGFSIVLEVRSKSTLISNSSSIKTILLLDKSLKMMVQLGAHPHGLGEAGGSKRQHHELLHGQLVASMGSSIDNIKARHWHQHVLHTSQVSNVTVQRNSFMGSPCLAHGHGDPQDSIGTQLVLVLSAIQGQHEAINLLLLHRVHALGHYLRSYQVVHIVHSLLHSLAVPSISLVSQLKSLINTSGSS